jgi:hypothetical protein
MQKRLNGNSTCLDQKACYESSTLVWPVLKCPQVAGFQPPGDSLFRMWKINAPMPAPIAENTMVINARMIFSLRVIQLLNKPQIKAIKNP